MKMKTKITNKALSIILTTAMLVSLSIIPHSVSAEDGYKEELIYSQDFSDFTENVDYVKDSYDNAKETGTVTPGTWYIGAGGRVVSHNLAYGAFAKGGFLKRTHVPYMFPDSFDNTQNEYEVSFKYKNHSGTSRMYLLSSEGDMIDLDITIWGTTPTYYGVKLEFDSTSCKVYRSDYETALKNISISGKKIVGMILFLYASSSSETTSYAWIDDVIVKQGDTVIASENFDDWQRADIDAQTEAMIAYKGAENVFQDTTPSLYARPDGADKCLATQWHTKGAGTGERITFVFPEVMTSGKYKITYDYLAAGNWCDYLYLYTSSGYSQVTINATQSNRMTAEIDIDIDNHTWSFNGYTPDTAGIVDETTDRIVFRMHQNAANGVEMLLDNVKIYKLSNESYDEIPEGVFSINSYEFTDDIGLELDSVPTDGIITANAVLGIATPGNYVFDAMIAAYDEEGTLLDINIQTVETTSKDSQKAVSLEIEATEETHSCQVFFWDMANGAITPLTNALALG